MIGTTTRTCAFHTYHAAIRRRPSWSFIQEVRINKKNRAPWFETNPLLQVRLTPYSIGCITYTDEPLPLLLSLVMGLQHAFAMVGGLITPPLTVFRFTINYNDVKSQQYAISAALITSGICTLIAVSKTPLPFSKYIFGRQLYIGSGVLSVMGVSFTFLPIYQIAIAQQVANGTDGYTAFGKMLGTSMVCGLIPLFISVQRPSFIAVCA